MTLYAVLYRVLGLGWKIRMPYGSFPATFEAVDLVIA